MSMLSRETKTALWILKVAEFFHLFVPILPVIVLIYQNKGVGLGDFFMIQGIFRIVAFLFEIPSGYLADVFSRRKILILGALATFLSFSILLFGTGFWAVLLCESGLGVATALFSGTKEAYIYDLLKRDGAEKTYLRENGSVNTIGTAGTMVGTLIGGALFAISQNLVLTINAMAALIMFLILFFIPEITEVKRKVAPESSPLRDCLKIVSMTARHPELPKLMLYSALYGTFATIVLWLMQPVMVAALVPVALFGVILGINNVARMLCYKFAYKSIERLGNNKTLWLSVIWIFAGFWAALGAIWAAGNMPIVYVLCVIMAIVPAVQALVKLVFNGFIHERTESHERGTVISIGSMIKSGVSGVIMILLKPILDSFGIVPTIILFFALAFVLVVMLNPILRAVNRR